MMKYVFYIGGLCGKSEHISSLFISLLLGGALLGCGGGGGGSSSVDNTVAAPTAVITEQNATKVANDYYQGQTSVSSQAMQGKSMVVGAVSQVSKGIGLVEIVQWQFDFINAHKTDIFGNATPTGAVESRNLPCPLGGSMSVSANDADNNNDVSAGDSMDITMNGCVIEAQGGTGTVTGNMNISVTGFQGNQASLVVNITNLRAHLPDDDSTINGDMSMFIDNISSGKSSIAVSGNNLSMALASGTRTLSRYKMDIVLDDVSNARSSMNYAFSGLLSNSATLGGTIDFKTTTRFQSTLNNYPSAGVMVATGAKSGNTAKGNSSLTLTVIDSTKVRIDIDTNGDGVAEKSPTVPWSEVNL